MQIKTTMEELERIVYDSHSLSEMQAEHIRVFESKKNLADTLIANKLKEYVIMTKKTNSLESLAWKLRGYKSFMKNAFDEMGIHIKFTVRTKDYIGFLKNSLLYVMTDKPLSKLMDVHGFRLTIGSQERDDELSHNLCDLATNMSFLYLSSHGWIMLEAEPTIETDFSEAEHPEVYITKKDLVFYNFEENVKNYKKAIKKNGYQRIHFYVKSPEGILVEGQIGTYAMDSRCPDEEHTGYKDYKYRDVKLQIDPSKIISEKFMMDVDGKIKDPEGILISTKMEV